MTSKFEVVLLPEYQLTAALLYPYVDFETLITGLLPVCKRTMIVVHCILMSQTHIDGIEINRSLSFYSDLYSLKRRLIHRSTVKTRIILRLQAMMAEEAVLEQTSLDCMRKWIEWDINRDGISKAYELRNVCASNVHFMDSIGSKRTREYLDFDTPVAAFRLYNEVLPFLDAYRSSRTITAAHANYNLVVTNINRVIDVQSHIQSKKNVQSLPKS